MAFERSLDVLLRLIAQNQQADVAVLSKGDSRLQNSFAKWVSLPLQAAGTGGAPEQQELFLGWRQPSVAADVSASGPLMDALKLVLGLKEDEKRLHQRLAEAASLQWKLADSKIADRTTGLIASGDTDPSDIRQHIFKVLAPILEDAAAASERIAKLSSGLEDRERISAAKIVLQHKHACTEEEAYVYLKQASRRSRRTIAAIAAEVCESEAGGSRRIA